MSKPIWKGVSTPLFTEAEMKAQNQRLHAELAFNAILATLKVPRILALGWERSRQISIHINGMAGWDVRDTAVQEFVIGSMRTHEMVVLGLEAMPVVLVSDYHARMIKHIARLRALPLHEHAKLLITIHGCNGMEVNNIMKIIRTNFHDVHFNLDDYRKPGTSLRPEQRRQMLGSFVELAQRGAALGIYENFITTDLDRAGLLEKFRVQLLRQFDPSVVRARGEHDDVAATVVEAVFFARNVFLEPRYRHML